MSELAMAATLFFMFPFSRYGAANCFSVRNVQLFLQSFDSVFSLYFCKNVFQMNVTHTM